MKRLYELYVLRTWATERIKRARENKDLATVSWLEREFIPALDKEAINLARH